MRSNNNKASGGFPHSDISGSKPIPGSPKLNAGYHVLHRLLLPRHPPNALFALNLIQKEQGRLLPYTSCVVCKSKPHVKSCILSHRRITFRVRLVSVLDLEQYRSLPESKCSHTREHQAILMFLSLYDVNFARDRTIKPSEEGLMILSLFHASCLMPHKPWRPVQEWWVEEDLNLRPHAYQACALTT